MDREERAVKTKKREEIDYLPSRPVFADRTGTEKAGRTMGFETIVDLGQKALGM